MGISALMLYIAHFELREEVFEIYFFNLNRGRSVFIRTPHNKTILIDGGQNGEILRELTKVLPFYRRRIDTIILTSEVPKNSGGLVEVLKRYSVGEIVTTELIGTSTSLYQIKKTIKEKSIESKNVLKGDSFEIDEVTFDILFPNPLFKFNKTSTSEMVLKISYGLTSVLLLGDISKTIQKTFISELEKVSIAEYAHSAGDSRTSGDLFEKIKPEFAIIKKQIRKTPVTPPKKLPKKLPFDIERVRGTKIVNLEKEGRVRFVSDGNKFLKK